MKLLSRLASACTNKPDERLLLFLLAIPEMSSASGVGQDPLCDADR
jgi:hypothetical protein